MTTTALKPILTTWKDVVKHGPSVLRPGAHHTLGVAVPLAYFSVAAGSRRPTPVTSGGLGGLTNAGSSLDMPVSTWMTVLRPDIGKRLYSKATRAVAAR